MASRPYLPWFWIRIAGAWRSSSGGHNGARRHRLQGLASAILQPMVAVNHSRAALRKQWESSMLGFLAAELEMATTLVKLVRDSRDLHRQAMHIANAQKACDAVEYFLGRAPLPAVEVLRIREELDSIRISLACGLLPGV